MMELPFNVWYDVTTLAQLIAASRLEKAYKLEGKLEYQELPISIETDKGSKRHWKDPSSGEEGTTMMKYPYGYIRGTLGTDGDEVDVFVGPLENDKVFVITQTKAPDFKEIDEQKVMLGFASASAAKKAYLEHYNDSRFFHSIKELSMDSFKEKLKTHRGKLIKHLLASSISANIQGEGDRMACDHPKDESCKECDDPKEMLKALTSRMLSMVERPAPPQEEVPTAEDQVEVPLRGPEVARALHVDRRFEPPSVPVVSIKPQFPTTSVTVPDALTSCNSCGYTHKSLNECPRCTQLRDMNSRVSQPIWRR